MEAARPAAGSCHCVLLFPLGFVAKADPGPSRFKGVEKQTPLLHRVARSHCRSEGMEGWLSRLPGDSVCLGGKQLVDSPARAWLIRWWSEQDQRGCFLTVSFSSFISRKWC